MRRVAIVATASGCGKTTLARELAGRLGVPHVELDALVHGPGWSELPSVELVSRLEPVLDGDGWVVDGGYWGKLGDLVLRRADLVVWLDLPLHVWLPRLLARTAARIVRRDELWNGNRETVRSALWGRDALVWFALRHHRGRRREYPARLAPYATARLRSQREVDRFLAAVPPR